MIQLCHSVTPDNLEATTAEFQEHFDTSHHDRRDHPRTMDHLENVAKCSSIAQRCKHFALRLHFSIATACCGARF